MVLCKYFMEGYCKYGSRCRFEHNDPYDRYDTSRDNSLTTDERSSGKSILKDASTGFGQQLFNQVNNTTFGGNVFNQGSNLSFGDSTFSYNSSGQDLNQTTNPFFGENSINQNHNTAFKVQGNFQQNNSPMGALKFNVQDIMEVVSKEILLSEKGNQWPLSAYSPHKDLPNLKGLEDHMPEELRWECYKASQNGTLPIYQAVIHQLYSSVAKVNNDLKKKDTAYAIINGWLQNVESKVETPLTSPFDGNQSIISSKTQMYSQPTSDNSFTFPIQQQTTQVHSHPGADKSVFGGSNQDFHQTQNLTYNLTGMDKYTYSEMDQLDEKDLESFRGDKFTLGAIPTKAPPKVLTR